MKIKTIVFIISILIFTSCSEEPKTILFNSEAFAFSIGDGWEINASVNAKGFAQIEKDNSELYFTNLNYTVNLYTPEDTIYNADYGSVIDSTNEEILDKQIESQIELNSGFMAGNYLIEFIVEDKYSNTKDTLSTKLVLE
ncbi:MAG: hypothetical protein COW71_06045 [Ignavibacteriales bacterium CG18_big_fil_WC_8_21_14_2_50_31_20]|nr:MAG: hypothetical protein COW71_06045 [Ignavibacteriales bacterium CG18_big_fil_WC_8_21_14_2_50_31_20]